MFCCTLLPCLVRMLHIYSIRFERRSAQRASKYNKTITRKMSANKLHSISEGRMEIGQYCLVRRIEQTASTCIHTHEYISVVCI